MQHLDVNMIQLGIELSFFQFPLEKQTVGKQCIHNCGWAGFEVDIFSSTNGSRSFKTLATDNLKRY